MYRHSLSSQSIRASIVFGSRCKEGLVNDDELVALLRDKASRAGRPRRREREERARARARDIQSGTGDEEESSGGEGGEEDGDGLDLDLDLDGEWSTID